MAMLLSMSKNDIKTDDMYLHTFMADLWLIKEKRQTLIINQ